MLIQFFSFSKKYFFAVLVLSSVFVVSSGYWASEMVYHDADLRGARSGFPLGYRSTDFGSEGYVLPQRMNSFMYPGQGYTTTIWYLFFLNIVIMQFVFSAILFLAYAAFPKTQKFFKFLSLRNIIFSLILFVIVFVAYELDFYYQFLRAIRHDAVPPIQLQLPAPPMPSLPAVPTPR